MGRLAAQSLELIGRALASGSLRWTLVGAADFDPSKFEDHYEMALVELLKKKQAGFKPPKGKEGVAAPRNVINLMDALRASIAGDTKKPKAPSKRAGSAKKRA
jgi:DNA end-binding protein Ku